VFQFCFFHEQLLFLILFSTINFYLKIKNVYFINLLSSMSMFLTCSKTRYFCLHTLKIIYLFDSSFPLKCQVCFLEIKVWRKIIYIIYINIYEMCNRCLKVNIIVYLLFSNVLILFISCSNEDKLTANVDVSLLLGRSVCVLSCVNKIRLKVPHQTILFLTHRHYLKNTYRILLKISDY